MPIASPTTKIQIAIVNARDVDCAFVLRGVRGSTMRSSRAVVAGVRTDASGAPQTRGRDETIRSVGAEQILAACGLTCSSSHTQRPLLLVRPRGVDRDAERLGELGVSGDD